MLIDCEFILRVTLPTEMQDDEIVERLGSVGCNDALVGLGVKGKIALHFIRSANTVKEAISSAIEDIQRVIPGSKFDVAQF